MNEDIIDVSEYFVDYMGVLGSTSQVGSSVVITLDTSSSVTLLATDLTSLDAGDFLF